MKIQSYQYPKSSFLSVEKDMNIIVDYLIKNDSLKKMLYYTSRDCMDRPKLTDEETIKNMDGVLVLNFDNPVTKSFKDEGKGEVVFFSSKNKIEGRIF